MRRFRRRGRPLIRRRRRRFPLRRRLISRRIRIRRRFPRLRRKRISVAKKIKSKIARYCATIPFNTFIANRATFENHDGNTNFHDWDTYVVCDYNDFSTIANVVPTTGVAMASRFVLKSVVKKITFSCSTLAPMDITLYWWEATTALPSSYTNIVTCVDQGYASSSNGSTSNATVVGATPYDSHLMGRYFRIYKKRHFRLGPGVEKTVYLKARPYTILDVRDFMRAVSRIRVFFHYSGESLNQSRRRQAA